MIAGTREKVNTPVLDYFSISWINMFSWSMKSRLAWKMKLDHLCQHIQAYIGDQGGKCSSFRDFMSFITNISDVSRAINSNLLELLLTLQRAHSYKWNWL